MKLLEQFYARCLVRHLDSEIDGMCWGACGDYRRIIHDLLCVRHSTPIVRRHRQQIGRILDKTHEAARQCALEERTREGKSTYLAKTGEMLGPHGSESIATKATMKDFHADCKDIRFNFSAPTQATFRQALGFMKANIPDNERRWSRDDGEWIIKRTLENESVLKRTFVDAEQNFLLLGMPEI